MTKISSISRLENFYQSKEVISRAQKKKKPTDKIARLVQSKISQGQPSTLLGSSISPKLIMDMALPVLEERGEGVKKAPRKAAKKWGGKLIPVGLSPCPEMSPLNALLQLVLFLPGFRSLFSFAPRSFQSFSKFIERYLLDQAEHHSVSMATAQPLLDCLKEKLDKRFFQAPFDLPGFLFSLGKSAFPQLSVLMNGSDSIALHPDWHIDWDISLPFPFVADQYLSREGRRPMRPPEFFVSPHNKQAAPLCQIVQRQYFSHPDSHCYDLDAFIESRPDEATHGHYIAYVKIDGAWYQCDDEKVLALRSSNLNVPLHRSVLLHYKKVNLRIPVWR